MNSQFPLQDLLDIAHNQVEESFRTLGGQVAAEQECMDKLSLLERYRAEYQERFREAARSGITRIQLANYQQFLARLDTAITQQSAVAEQSHARTEQCQRELIEHRSRMQAFISLSTHHGNMLAAAEARREQKASDEFAGMRFREHEAARESESHG
ncbi:MAG: flagellar export protein FliJ [Rhodocyclaceae bacterium]|nr:flagellar export protein FliJ [Rhodocyclaceae bacterium]MBX3668642.1 flagellar export protein FliJ [Rhodocyclaceae bacterium]